MGSKVDKKADKKASVKPAKPAKVDKKADKKSSKAALAKPVSAKEIIAKAAVSNFDDCPLKTHGSNLFLLL